MPAPLAIPKFVTLKTLDEAARGGDPLDVPVALLMVLLFEGVECRER